MTNIIDKIVSDDLPATTNDKPKRIPRRIGEVVELLLSGACKTQKAACERTGMNQQYVSVALRKPEIRVFIARRVREHLSAGTLRASAKLLELIDSGSQRVAFEASKHVLALDGIRAVEGPSVSVNIDVKAGYVIDLRSNQEIRRGVSIAGTSPPTIDARPAADDC